MSDFKGAASTRSLGTHGNEHTHKHRWLLMTSYLVCESRNGWVVIAPLLLPRALAGMNFWAAFENVILQTGQVQREVRLTICTAVTLEVCKTWRQKRKAH